MSKNTKRSSLKKIWLAGEELVFPRRCPVCDDAVKTCDYLICRECRSKLRLIVGPLCMKCGKQLREQEEEYCFDCTRRKHFYIRGAALFDYSSAAASIYRFKYSGRLEYAEFFGMAMAKYMGAKIRSWKPEAFIPVPIHSSRMRKRGYNQAEALAKVLGREMGIPVRADIIKRNRNTAPQKDMNLTERQNNLKKAFKIVGNVVKLSTIVIIDDIYTTGNTIDAIGYEFQAVGVGNIYYVALSIGRGL